jgi:hypothetical protein
MLVFNVQGRRSAASTRGLLAPVRAAHRRRRIVGLNPAGGTRTINAAPRRRRRQWGPDLRPRICLPAFPRRDRLRAPATRRTSAGGGGSENLVSALRSRAHRGAGADVAGDGRGQSSALFHFGCWQAAKDRRSSLVAGAGHRVVKPVSSHCPVANLPRGDGDARLLTALLLVPFVFRVVQNPDRTTLSAGYHCSSLPTYLVSPRGSQHSPALPSQQQGPRPVRPRAAELSTKLAHGFFRQRSGIRRRRFKAHMLAASQLEMDR